MPCTIWCRIIRVEPHFREVQTFPRWIGVILVLPGLPMAFGAYQQLFLDRPWGARPSSNEVLTAIIGCYTLFVVWFLSLKLVTEVRDHEVSVHFVRLWRARKIPLESIRCASAVTYRPILDYGGWGIRMGRKGWAYNTSGNRGVELELDTGKLLLVGSQRPKELAAAIEMRKGTTGAGRPSMWNRV